MAAGCPNRLDPGDNYQNSSMQFDSLHDWLQWLEQLHPSEIDLGLDRIKNVAHSLHLLNPSARIVTVAGTNGKGSCLATLEKILLDAGIKVGTYTSPHLFHYCERIKVNGEPVDEKAVCDAFEKINQARKNISLTYFEFGTLAAMEIFCRSQVECILLEVGLGGRLDAVNIWDADLAVITSIAIDHEQWLGSDRENIGREKAGIFRQHQIAICADGSPPDSIADTAEKTGTRLLQCGRDFSAEFEEQSVGCNDKVTCWSWSGINAQGQPVWLKHLPMPKLPLPSVSAAVQAAQLLGVSMQSEAFAGLLQNLSLAGRWQHVHYRGRNFILDVAHNPAASELLASQIAENSHLYANAMTDGGEAAYSLQKVYGIVAMMNDKDRAGTLSNLVSVIDHWHVCDLPHLPRAAKAAELKKDLNSLDIQAEVSGSVIDALQKVVEAMGPADLAVVFGSFFTVSEAASCMMQPDKMRSEKSDD